MMATMAEVTTEAAKVASVTEHLNTVVTTGFETNVKGTLPTETTTATIALQLAITVHIAAAEVATATQTTSGNRNGPYTTRKATRTNETPIMGEAAATTTHTLHRTATANRQARPTCHRVAVLHLFLLFRSLICFIR